MGIVWKAIDERLERSVAVKQIITQPGLSEAERDTVRQRAMREARNAARFQHPNAVVVFDIAEHDGEPCLVMEYVPSRSLSALLIDRETLPVPEVARIGEQVASALIAAHRAGIVHRDIKPGNVLIDDQGQCKITDFGISRATGDLTLTQTGLVGGTPAYLAPELARGADPTPSSDVFALGATLYHAIEGLPPYGDNTNQLALLYAAANGNVQPPHQAGPATGLLTALLRADPQDRPSMTEARDQLAALARGRPVAAPAAAPAPPAKEHTRELGATPAAAAAPWRRDAAPQPAHTATATAGPDTPGHPGSAPDGRRRRLVFGAVAAVVLIAATSIVIVLTGGGEGGGESQAQESSTTPTAPSSSPAPVSSAVPNAGEPVTGFSTAGNFVLDYYSDPAGGWDRLAPGIQALWEGRRAHEQYWNAHGVEYAHDAYAYKKEPNQDGSLDIRIRMVTDDGEREMFARVVRLNGELRIGSDPRVEHNRKL